MCLEVIFDNKEDIKDFGFNVNVNTEFCGDLAGDDGVDLNASNGQPEIAYPINNEQHAVRDLNGNSDNSEQPTYTELLHESVRDVKDALGRAATYAIPAIMETVNRQ